jgi:hypothetical protein
MIVLQGRKWWVFTVCLFDSTSKWDNLEHGISCGQEILADILEACYII